MSRALKLFLGVTVVAVASSGWLFLTRSDNSNRPGTVGSITAPPLPSTVPSELPAATPTPVGAVTPTPPVETSSTGGLPVRGDRSEAGARRAAIAVVALDEKRMVSEQAAATMTAAVTSSGSRDVLVEQAIRQTRSLHRQLGDGLVLLSQPLRIRTVAFTESAADIDVWWVKVVSSPTQPTAGDLWGTTRVSLLWEDGQWKQSNEVSRLGPWPTHASDQVSHPSGALFLEQMTGFTPIENG